MYLANTFGEKVKFEIKTNETQADSAVQTTAAFENFEQNIEKKERKMFLFYHEIFLLKKTQD